LGCLLLESRNAVGEMTLLHLGPIGDIYCQIRRTEDLIGGDTVPDSIDLRKGSNLIGFFSSSLGVRRKGIPSSLFSVHSSYNEVMVRGGKLGGNHVGIGLLTRTGLWNKEKNGEYPCNTGGWD